MIRPRTTVELLHRHSPLEGANATCSVKRPVEVYNTTGSKPISYGEYPHKRRHSATTRTLLKEENVNVLQEHLNVPVSSGLGVKGTSTQDQPDGSPQKKPQTLTDYSLVSAAHL